MTKIKSYLIRMVYFQVQDKITQVQGEKSEIQSGPLYCYLIALYCCSIDARLLFNQSEVAYQQKIRKHKKPIIYPFETKIAIHFFFFLVFKGHFKLTLEGVLREKKEHLMAPIVDLGFLYPKLSKVFY